MKSKLKIPRKLNLKKRKFPLDEVTDNKISLTIPLSNNSFTLYSFALYCQQNPKERFWQALRNWRGCAFLLADSIDTFWDEGRRA